MSFKMIMFVITIVNFVATMLIEKVVVPAITQKWNQIKQGMLIKEVMSRQRSFNLNELENIKLKIKN
jgi:hypothetical protein